MSGEWNGPNGQSCKNCFFWVDTTCCRYPPTIVNDGTTPMIPYAEEPISQIYWNYRVAKNESDQFFSIRIVEYAINGSVIFVHKPEDSYPTKTDPEDFAKDLRRYVNALNRPVLEVP